MSSRRATYGPTLSPLSIGHMLNSASNMIFLRNSPDVCGVGGTIIPRCEKGGTYAAIHRDSDFDTRSCIARPGGSTQSVGVAVHRGQRAAASGLDQQDPQAIPDR